MKKTHKFYETEGRSVVYGYYDDELKILIENWAETTEVRVRDGIIYITERAFPYAVELMRLHELSVIIEQVAKEQENKIRLILGKIKESPTPIELDIQSELVDNNFYRLEVNQQFEIYDEDNDDEFYLIVNVKTDGEAKVDNGDRYTEPSQDTKLNGVEFEEMEIYLTEDGNNEVHTFNDMQYNAICKGLDKLVIYPL